MRGIQHCEEHIRDQVGDSMRIVGPAGHETSDRLEMVPVERLEHLRISGELRQPCVFAAHSPRPFAVRPIHHYLEGTPRSVTSRDPQCRGWRAQPKRRSAFLCRSPAVINASRVSGREGSVTMLALPRVRQRSSPRWARLARAQAPRALDLASTTGRIGTWRGTNGKRSARRVNDICPAASDASRTSSAKRPERRGGQIMRATRRVTLATLAMSSDDAST